MAALDTGAPVVWAGAGGTFWPDGCWWFGGASSSSFSSDLGTVLLLGVAGMEALDVGMRGGKAWTPEVPVPGRLGPGRTLEPATAGAAGTAAGCCPIEVPDASAALSSGLQQMPLSVLYGSNRHDDPAGQRRGVDEVLAIASLAI